MFLRELLKFYGIDGDPYLDEYMIFFLLILMRANQSRILQISAILNLTSRRRESYLGEVIESESKIKQVRLRVIERVREVVV